MFDYWLKSGEFVKELVKDLKSYFAKCSIIHEKIHDLKNHARIWNSVKGNYHEKIIQLERKLNSCDKGELQGSSRD